MRNIFFPKMEKGTFFSPISDRRRFEVYLPLTYSFSQFALFNQYFRNPWANPQGNLDNRKTRPVCVQRAPQIDQLQPITSSQEIEERPRT